ncbi:TOM1-like protein 2 [Dermatophagoides pteronyssinus]|uniref:TOM1-like protein 2 n=2 Tax=Dermatophagoides pteronyssinus TaxID=6956 RepID=A0A6P6Y314_DERPT|nr:TOM1-like protein 2 [Dermatophagoides pteronyssinus]XP_027199452.1 TOM1-like protein 2 [Dermatophagoides pteronyssinus]KAH9424812.1 TOM1-like protein 2 [Dermatophagoides pteronyssinus]
MADLLQRFSGNPFSTSVGQRIEQATDPSLDSENWALNMEICDIINDTEDGPRDALRAIKKRLQQTAGKNFTVFKLTLTVLETCVKNCGKRFHILVSSKDFIQDLVKLIGPKNDPPAEIQEKVLSLIQSWAEAFHGQPEMQGVSIVYNELRNKGIEFPKSSNEPKVPIYTPQRQISPAFKNQEMASSPPKHPMPGTSPTNQVTSATRATSELYPIHLSPEQLNKLKIELEVVQGNMKVMSEMLTKMKPGQEHKDDWTLLIELNQTLVSMQKRIVDLIEKVANEEVTSELLRINDELNNLFMRFDRYQKKRGGNNDGDQRKTDIDLMPSTSSKLPHPNPKNMKSINPPSLIDFTDENEGPDLIDGLKKLDMNSSQSPQMIKPSNISTSSSQQPTENMGDKEFDMFAQSRSSTTATTSSSIISQASSTSKPTNIGSRPKDPAPLLSTEEGQEKEMEEIERWLNTKPGEPSMSFEAFLEKRANALDKQPLKKPNNNGQDPSLI